ELLKCIQDVLALDIFDIGDQPAIFNACALLPLVVQVNADETGTFLIDLARNPKTHDAVRLWAFKSMAELPPVNIYTILNAGQANAAEKRDLDIKRVDGLLAFLNRKMPDNVTPDAERFLRRQAIRALAATEAPAVEIDKVNKVSGPAVYGLLATL